jgi:phage terminase large subunit-like protein
MGILGLKPAQAKNLLPALYARREALKKEAESRRKIDYYFPDEGPYRRELYKKQVEFFAAGKVFKERMFMAGNRLGKSDAGSYEVACHATGEYPKWWVGRKFEGPVEIWAAGTTSETTRDIVQNKLLGGVGKEGTGMIPADAIIKTVPKRGGIADAIETIWVRHKAGGHSLIGLKSYQQGRESFEGTAKSVIWLDEEPPQDIYTECLFRTATTKGIVIVTFTPLSGMSEVVKGFLEPEKIESKEYKWHIQAGWKDVPHIEENERKALIATTPPYQIKARTEGEPSLGAGAIYPIAESEITCQVFSIPKDWPRAFAMDVGWNRTAALWGARDPGTGIIYIYSEHYAGQMEPARWRCRSAGR